MARRSPSRLRTLIGIAALLPVLSLVAATNGPLALLTDSSTSTSSGGDTTAHLHLTVVTTSDWTVVRFPGSELLSPNTLRSAGNVEVLPDGVRLTGPAGDYKGVALDLVLESLATSADPVVEITRGNAGATRVRLEALDEDLEVVQLDHGGVVAGDPTNTKRVRVARAQLFGSDATELVRGDDRPLVLAFYYPWFSDYSDARLTDRPADARPTDSQPDVDAMTAEAAANGVDGFIVSWAGQERNGYGFDLAQRAAAANDQLVAGYFEASILRADAGGDPAAQLALARQWMDELLLRARPWYATYLRDRDGLPVVFAYRVDSLSPDVWRTLLDELEADGSPVRIIGDTVDPAYADVQGGLHVYSALGTEQGRTSNALWRANRLRAEATVAGDEWSDIVVGGVAPGYNDTLVRPPGTIEPRGTDGARYDATWRAALAGDPDWVTITSWNEWYEGTSVEPSRKQGALALQQTAEWAASFRAHHLPALGAGG